MSAGLPTHEEMLRNALTKVERANSALSTARDWLAANWHPGGSLTDDEADARSIARDAIAKAKRELTPAMDALLRVCRDGIR